MERESGRLSALHMVDQLKSELNRLADQSFDSNNVGSSKNPIVHIADGYEQQHVQYVDSQDRDEVSA